MKLIFYYFLLFFIYSILGWIMEILCIALEDKKWVNRGFLIGPYCPIYGCGSIAMVWYLTQYKDNILTVFILGVVICSVLEYITSYIMEKLFKARWWDYSNRKFNLNGRVCGFNSLLFGIGGILVIYVVQPFLERGLNYIPNNVLIVLGIIAMITFVVDMIISLNVVNRFKKTITSIDFKKDSSEDFTKMVQEAIRNNHKIFQKRLLKAFPNLNFRKLNAIKDEITEELKDLLKK